MIRSAAKRNRGQNRVVSENQDFTYTESSGNPRERKIPNLDASIDSNGLNDSDTVGYPPNTPDGGIIRSKPTRRQDGNFLYARKSGRAVNPRMNHC